MKQLRIMAIDALDSRRRFHVEIFFVSLLTAGAFLVRLWGMPKLHFWDENVYLLNAGFLFNGTNNYTEIDSRPPLLSILFAGAFHIWHSDYAAWIVTALLNALGPAFIYLAGRKLVGKNAAAIAALLLAFSPLFVGIFLGNPGDFVDSTFGHSLLADCPALSLILLSFWLLVRALERQTDLRFAAAGFSLALAVLMRFGSLSSAGLLALLVLAANRRMRAAAACVAGFLAGVGPYLCWSRIHYGGFFETFRSGWGNFDGPPESFFFYLKNFALIFSWLTLAGLALWIVWRAWETLARKNAAPGDGERLLGQGQWRWEAFLWFWALAVLLFFSILSHKELRYAIPVAPPLLLLAGIGLGTLIEGRRTSLRFAGGAVLCAALMVSFWPVRHRFDTGFLDPAVSDEMIISDFLRHNVSSGTVLYTNQNYPDFAYYSEMKVIPLPESGDELYESLGHLPGDGIVIAYRKSDSHESEMAAEPRLDWLDANPHYRRMREYPSWVLYDYHALLPKSRQAGQ